MESLLCNEVWLTSPNTEEEEEENDDAFDSNTKVDCEEAFVAFLGKETTYLPRSGYYSNLVDIHDLIANARFKAVTWIIKVLFSLTN